MRKKEHEFMANMKYSSSSEKRRYIFQLQNERTQYTAVYVVRQPQIGVMVCVARSHVNVMSRR